MTIYQDNKDFNDTMYKAYVDTRVYASSFMPDRFWRPWKSIHDDFFKFLDDPDANRIAIAAPRGFGKTTSMLATGAKRVCYKDCRFLEFISCTHKIASENVKNLGRELVGNKEILKVFGNLRGQKWSEGDGHLETNTGITLLARGAGQQVRGLLVGGGARPDLILVDDLEDSEPFRIGDPAEYLRKLKEWFWSDLMNSIDRRGTKIIVVGTVLHEDSLLQNLLDDSNWKSVRLELFDDNYTSNYPDLMSTEEVKAMAAEYAERGMLDLLFQEYRNLCIARHDASFKQEYFKYWNVDKNPAEDPYVEKIVIVDPAKTVKLHSAYSAIVGVGFDAVNGKIYQLDTINEKLHPEEIYEKAYSMARRLGTFSIGVETTSLELFIKYPFDNYLRQRGFPETTALKAVGDKDLRIKELVPFYRMGCVYHHPDASIHQPLESQLVPFPRSKYKDVSDAFAYLIKAFSLNDRHFQISEHEDLATLETEIAKLDAIDDRFERISQDWRQAP